MVTLEEVEFGVWGVVLLEEAEIVVWKVFWDGGYVWRDVRMGCLGSAAL